jgi:hypothetical protein
MWHALGHGDPTGTSGCSQFGRAADACQGLDFARGMGARDSPLMTASDRCVGHDEGTTGTLPRSPDHLIRVRTILADPVPADRTIVIGLT